MQTLSVSASIYRHHFDRVLTSFPEVSSIGNLVFRSSTNLSSSRIVLTSSCPRRCLLLPTFHNSCSLPECSPASTTIQSTSFLSPDLLPIVTALYHHRRWSHISSLPLHCLRWDSSHNFGEPLARSISSHYLDMKPILVGATMSSSSPLVTPYLPRNHRHVFPSRSTHRCVL